MKASHDRILRLIAVFKFLKSAMLIALGVGAFRLLHKDLGEVLAHWAMAFRVDPGNRFVDAALAKVSNLRPQQIRELGLGSFLYAALFLTEGTGLWLQKRWGEWLTVIITGSLLPVEIYEIFRRANWAKLGVLAINVGILWYLIGKVRGRRVE
jgi:uncharacterized membrane protein (DUF2068 family)